MKRILITGANSYIGASLEKYMAQWPERYQVEKLSLRGDKWKGRSFSTYDAVIHTAGIVHIKESEENAQTYFDINRDLAADVAKKAKNDGALQFVFLSTASVYGMDEGVITKDTVPLPVNNYGKSKLQAEQLIRQLHDVTFTVTILRPPMVYGEGCKGNYQTLTKIAEITPIFPAYRNERSLIHVDTLAAYVCGTIETRQGGIFFPQDREYSCTSRMIQQIAEKRGKKIILVPFLNPAVRLAIKCTRMGKKAFGSLIFSGEQCIERF